MVIVPKVKKISFSKGSLFLKNLYCVADDSKIYSFAKKLFHTSESNLKPAMFKYSSNLKKEQYKILSSEDGILIEYATIEGAFRAFTTLKQIFDQAKNGEIPFLEIEDEPSIPNRGYMLDISRGKVPKLSYLKKLVNLLADLKYNQLQLYVDSFVFEYKNFMHYGENSDRLTAKDIMDLDLYCKKHFIQLVPNQNSFGHMAAWTSQKELSHLAITKENGAPSAVLNPLLQETVELVDKIYDGYLDLFSSPYVHIGCDETVELGTGETKEACERYGRGKVFVDHLNKICELVRKKYNKTPMFWDDILFRHPESIKEIAKDGIFMQWGYEAEFPFERNCRLLDEKGFRYYVCPGTSMWGSLAGRMNNMVANVSKAAEIGNLYHAEGFLLTEWGDGGHPQMPANSYFPLVFGANYAWNAGPHHYEDAYLDRMTRLNDCRYYLDKFVYKTKNENSLSEIVFSLGNSYLLEYELQFNHTCLVSDGVNIHKVSPDKIYSFKRVMWYVKSLKKQLRSVKANKKSVEEVRLTMDIMILFLDWLINGISKQLEQKIDAVSKRFQRIWVKDNLPDGAKYFITKMKKIKTAEVFPKK